MFYLFLADGFEEIEALATVDILRRCGVDVITCGVDKKDIVGAHKISVKSDILDSQINLDSSLEGVILPGGMPGTINEEKSAYVQNAIDYACENNLLLAAICAAPSILGRKEILKDKNAICYPGYEDQLLGANLVDDSVVVSNNVITAKGAGVTIDFALAIAEKIKGKSIAEKIKKSMQCK